MTEKEWYIEGDGELVHYPQIYQADDDKIALAEGLEQYIIEQQQNIESSFLKIGAALIKFEDDELYLARGVPSMKAWLDGPEFTFTYAHATRLMRIVRDLLPVIGDAKDRLPISTMKELLPMLSEGATPEEIQHAVEEVEGLTTRDAKRRLRELRGVEEREIPTIFRARVRTGEAYNRVWITRTGEDGVYDMTPSGPVLVRPADFAHWADRFGFAIEYE